MQKDQKDIIDHSHGNSFPKALVLASYALIAFSFLVMLSNVYVGILVLLGGSFMASTTSVYSLTRTTKR